MAPDRTIAASTFSGRKKQKTRFTLFACCNADGPKKYPLLFIGIAVSPRCLKKKSPESLSLLYRTNKEAWMTSALVSTWLQMLDAYIERTPHRHALSLMDSCSAHGTSEIQPHLQNAIVNFYPLHTQ